MKLLFLIRDPRGIANSRLALFRAHSQQPGICITYNRFIRERKRHDAMWRDKVLTIRYEDLVAKPLEMVKHIYAFLNLPLVDQIPQYLSKHAHKERNWIKHLNWETVNLVQSTCGEMMSTFGYKKAKDETEYRMSRYVHSLAISFENIRTYRQPTLFITSKYNKSKLSCR